MKGERATQQMKIRLPDDLKARIEMEALAARRSQTDELVLRVQQRYRAIDRKRAALKAAA